MENRLKEAMRIRGLRQVDLVEMTGIPKSTICSYAIHRFEPASQNLHLLAKALNVSEMWLAGFDTPMERRIDMSKDADAERLARMMIYNEKLYELMRKASVCSDEQLILINGVLDQIVKE